MTDRHPHPHTASALIVLALLAVLPGYATGVGTWLVLWCVDQLREAVWHLIAVLPGVLPAIAPLVLCTAGGLVVGLWTRRCGYTLDTMDTVVQTIRRDGAYHVRSWGQSLGLFFAPIVFGGSVGPEAGISGFAAAGMCSTIRRTRIGGASALTADEHPFADAMEAISHGSERDVEEAKRQLKTLPGAKPLKSVFLALAGLAFAAGCMSVVKVLGPAGEMPRFAPIPYAASDWGAGALALAAGYGLSLFGDAASFAARRWARRIGDDPVKRALACGIILGAAACVAPEVLFSGQSGLFDLIGTWQTWAPGALAGVALLKLAATKLCVASDWVGGEFFPTIFCGAALGYAIASVTGADPLLPVALATASAVAAWTGKPLLTTAVLALCFPPATLPVVLLASWAASRLPHPHL